MTAVGENNAKEDGSVMVDTDPHDILEPQPDYRDKLYQRHVRGALVRSGASVIMGLSALMAFLVDVINIGHLAGVSAAIAYLILINPPTLWVLKRITRKRTYEFFSIFINVLEIIGYTAIMYFLGGYEATYLTPIYAALITYVGIVAPRKLPFVIAGICSASFIAMVALEHYGILPHHNVSDTFYITWETQLINLLVITALLCVVAFISSYTAHLLKTNRGKLQQQNVKLEVAMNKARESDRAKSEFLATMSHELRTPLNHIIGFTELIVDKNFGELNGMQEEYLNDVLYSGRHLLLLINDILDLSKIEAGKHELILTNVNLSILLENSLVMVKEKAIKQGIKISSHFDSIPEYINADERKLKQILYNLLSNAVKFTPGGGSITLAAKLDTGYSIVGHGNADKQTSCQYPILNHDRNFVEISVKDTGIGISPEDTDRIFNPFEQVDGSPSREYQGTGLGLSLTKQLVELHGGAIWVESVLNQGSTFRIVLPYMPGNKQ